jgi:hypothetical protein
LYITDHYKNVVPVSVHDCFWTHACDVEEMNQTCRQGVTVSPTLGRTFWPVRLENSAAEKKKSGALVIFFTNLKAFWLQKKAIFVYVSGKVPGIGFPELERRGGGKNKLEKFGPFLGALCSNSVQNSAAHLSGRYTF